MKKHSSMETVEMFYERSDIACPKLGSYPECFIGKQPLYPLGHAARPCNVEMVVILTCANVTNSCGACCLHIAGSQPQYAHQHDWSQPFWVLSIGSRGTQRNKLFFINCSEILFCYCIKDTSITHTFSCYLTKLIGKKSYISINSEVTAPDIWSCLSIWPTLS